MEDSGERAERRRQQQMAWMRDLLRERLLDRFDAEVALTELRSELERRVHDGEVAPSIAVDRLLEAWDDIR